MTGRRPDWRAIHDTLARRDPGSLTAAELDQLAESLFWLDRPHDSVDARGRAFTAHVAAGDHAGAAMSAWQLFYDHGLVGETALASGWLERARRHAAAVAGSVAQGFLAVAESDHAAAAGELGEAAAHADRAVDIGRSTGDADLVAMALQARGRVLVASGRLAEGIAALDEAMVAAVNGELAPLFTGWVYCNALSTCHDLADLSRAVEWSEAAVRWGDALQDGRFYPGICRLHVVELASLRGAWASAAAQAQQACDELTSHDPRYAGEAHYLIGELHRVRGDLDLAEEAFAHAHRLGREPQPGLARIRIAQGRLDAAVSGLRLALDPRPWAPMRRAELLEALVEACLAAGGLDDASSARDELDAVAGEVPSDYLGAISLRAGAAVALASAGAHEDEDHGSTDHGSTDHGMAACRLAGEAVRCFQALGLPYDEARARELRGAAAEVVGDHDTARLELTLAGDTFRRLGADPDARRVAARSGDAPASPLSSRETEVLRLVARGGSNKEVAAQLFVSEHTVARHLSNIYTKLGVRSRSAATAFAHDHSLL